MVINLTIYAQLPKEEFEAYRKHQIAIMSGDTIINNGDGKVVIIDKRPRTIVQRPITPKAEAQPIIINIPENRDLEHYLYYHQKQSTPVDNSRWDVVAVLLFILLMGILLWLLLKPIGSAAYEKQLAQNHYPPAPVINHFHVSGGYSSAYAGAENDQSRSSYNREYYGGVTNPLHPGSIIRKNPDVFPQDPGMKTSL